MSAVTVPPYGCVTRALVENKSLTLGARLLYVELLCLPHEADGAVVETYAQLAQRLGVSESSVKRWIKALGGAGLLEWRQGGLRDHRKVPNRYRLLEIVPKSRPLPRFALPGGAVGVEAGVEELAVAAEPAAEREDVGGVLEAEPGDGAGVGAGGARCGAADADVDGGRERVRVARHGAESTPGNGVRGWSS